MTKLDIRELTPDLWPAIERLFGPRGACGGCWCMYWRVEKGERWADLKGATNRARFRALVESGGAHGLIASAGGEPVGWCSFERRLELPRLGRARTLACDDADRVWSLPCFFIASGWRRRGVAAALLDAAVAALRRRRAEVIEGYPVRRRPGGEPVPAAFAWTGTEAMFARAGFEPVGGTGAGKQRMRLHLRVHGGR